MSMSLRKACEGCRRLFLPVIFVIALVATSANAQIWVASTGAVDEGSLSSFQFTGGAAYLRSSITTGSATLRFNVLPVGTLKDLLTNPCCEGRVMLVRFLDNGSGAQVTVSLKRYNLTTGQVTTLLSFDS